jgi:hypothetical protein
MAPETAEPRMCPRYWLQSPQLTDDDDWAESKRTEQAMLARLEEQEARWLAHRDQDRDGDGSDEDSGAGSGGGGVGGSGEDSGDRSSIAGSANESSSLSDISSDG